MRHRLLLFSCAVALAAPATATATTLPYAYPVHGAEVLVQAMPGQPAEVLDAIEQTLLLGEDETALPLDPRTCSTDRVVVTAEKQSRMDAKWAETKQESKRVAGLFLPGRAGQDCRIWLNARSLRRLDPSQVCHLLQHELGHARGLEHTKTGLMASSLPFWSEEPQCEWAWSFWNDEEE